MRRSYPEALWGVYLSGRGIPFEDCQKRCVMPDDTDEIVGSIGHELVSRLAPEELPLYPSLVSQFTGC